MHTTLLFVKMGGGGGGGSVALSLRFIISSPTWPVFCFSVMSDLNLDNPGFQSQGATPPAPPFHLVLHRTPRQTDAPVLHATGGCVRSRLTVILFVFLTSVMFVILNIA